MVAQVKHAMGGRAAEKLVLNYISTGASNDLKQATEMARNMVCLYGMNDHHRSGLVRRWRSRCLSRPRLHVAQQLQRTYRSS